MQRLDYKLQYKYYITCSQHYRTLYTSTPLQHGRLCRLLCVWILFLSCLLHKIKTQPLLFSILHAEAGASAFCSRPEEAADVNKQTSHCAGLQLTAMCHLNGYIQCWDDDNDAPGRLFKPTQEIRDLNPVKVILIRNLFLYVSN